jgi:hypothetical protein
MSEKLNTKAGLGNEYPIEFIEALARRGFETLKTWLEANNLPEAVIDLFEDCWMLKIYSKDIEKGELKATASRDLVEIIPGMTKRIAELGGTF